MQLQSIGSLGDVTLPLEALGAREYVTRLHQRMRSGADKGNTIATRNNNSSDINANDNNEKVIYTNIEGDGGYNHISNNDDDKGNSINNAENDLLESVGVPLPAATEPIDEKTGRRLVYFSRNEEPIAVLAERRARFLHIVFSVPKLGTGTGTVSIPLQYVSAYGTVLGYSDDDTEIIWHERGDLYASRVPISAIASATCIHALQCLHCARVVPKDEVGPHLEQHVKGLGRVAGGGTFINHPVWGTACGDTGVLQRLERVRKIGSGAQGDVYLCRLHNNDSHSSEHSNHYTSDGNPMTSGNINSGNSGGGEEGNNNNNNSSREANEEGPLFAVKCMHSRDAVALYHRAVRCMALRHEHIIEYIAVRLIRNPNPIPTTETSPRNNNPNTNINNINSESDGVVEVVMPLHREGDLAGLIRRTPVGGQLRERRIATIALQAAAALAVLHERNPPLAHGDLKVENLLLDKGGRRVVLTDLETCEEIARHRGAAAHVDIGTTAWMAPETRHRRELTPAADMWALGLLLYVLAVLPDFPMMYNPNTNEEGLLNDSVWGEYEKDMDMNMNMDMESAGDGNPKTIRMAECVVNNIMSRGYSKALAQLTAGLLSYDPAKRPRANAVREELTEIITNLLVEETKDSPALSDDTAELS